jgi:undecaprenyl pyrophosphate synthase
MIRILVEFLAVSLQQNIHKTSSNKQNNRITLPRIRAVSLMQTSKILRFKCSHENGIRIHIMSKHNCAESETIYTIQKRERRSNANQAHTEQSAPRSRE